MKERIEVICRAARESDTGDVIELTRTIWDGEDYVPRAWPRWLADTQGRLIVAEYEGRVIGLTRLKRQSEDAWWLQGLRVHPEFQGHSVATQLHRASVDAWRAIGSGTLRLATASTNTRVHHLCKQDSFALVGEYTIFIAYDPEPGEAANLAGEIGGDGFEQIAPQETQAVIAQLRGSPASAWQNGLLELGWQFAPVLEKYVKQVLDAGMGWRQPAQDTLVLLYDDEDDGRPRLPFIEGLACPPDGLAELLGDYRRLAKRLGYPGAAWIAPVTPAVLAALKANGFEREWDDSLFVFALS